MKDITLCACGKMTYTFLKNFNEAHSINGLLVTYGILYNDGLEINNMFYCFL
jgi:hypothetical protein